MYRSSPFPEQQVDADWQPERRTQPRSGQLAAADQLTGEQPEAQRPQRPVRPPDRAPVMSMCDP
jgi:hypothetical protein